MSLATRCTQCGTIFRVVQDQLKVSQGWVRCGRCQEVFSALEGLFDLEREAPPQRPAAALTPTQVALQEMAEFVASRSQEPLASSEARFPSTHEDDAIESRFLAREDDTQDDEDPDFLDARFPSELPEDAAADGGPGSGSASFVPQGPGSSLRRRPGWRERRAEKRAAAISSMLSGQDDESTFQAVLPTPAAPAPPGFLRQAEQAAQWQRPRVRASLVVASLLLAGLLATQIAVQFRDSFAARSAQARPALHALCDVMSCRIEPPRRLAAFSVESSGLTQIEGADAYRLRLGLLNRDTVALTLPAVDLRLTDASGSLIARRTLAPSDFEAIPAAGTAVLPAGAETQLQANFAVAGARIGGYTVELFYP